MGDDPGLEDWEQQIREKRSRDSQRKRQQGHKEEKDWRKNPPYVLAEPDQHREAKYRGSCHCEKVKFEVFDDPLDAHFCHCTTCQAIHGAPVHWSAIIEKDSVHFINGADGIASYRTSDKRKEHELPCKLSCDHCHSPIADEGKRMLLLYPSLLKLESHQDREPWTPRRHVFYSQRCLDVRDGQEKYEGMQYKSDLVPEESDQVGIIGKTSRVDRDPNEADGKERSDNSRQNGGEKAKGKKRKKGED